MASSTLVETERIIREKLEASGQYGKMRAMIMEAALQTVSTGGNNNSGVHQPLVFHPTVALRDAKQNGVTELSIVQEYLQYLGLQYTARVLQLEAGLQEVALRTSAELQEQLHIAVDDRSDPCLSALVHGRVTGVVPSTAATGTPAAAAEEEDTNTEDIDDTASDHNQPGGENTTYFISKWKKRHFMRHNQVSGQQVQIEYLTDCHTAVLDELDSMTVDDCEGGELVIAACEGSVFLRNCKNMTIHVACKQLRTRDCEHIKLYIFTSTDPVVEMSHHISFYPFHLRLPGLRRLFAEARLDPKANRFVHVYDFTPTEPQLPKPHFDVHFPDHHLSMEDRYASYGALDCPPEIEELLALRLMPAASSESGKNKSYDIRTGAQMWAQAGPTPAPAVAAAAAAVGTAATTSANAHAESGDDDDEEEIASDSDHSGSSPQSTSASTASSSEAEEYAPAERQIAGQSAMQRIGGLSAAAPLGPIPAVGLAAHAVTSGGIDNEEYSSFDDDDNSNDADDKCNVDEDEDDF
ncbi:hypothetical protein LPMP_180610 [Leishmania panamensis]|uniref:C-CAP/cofactor C-like domain-containing protein n=1 Tax=Leishmania panamensis TaxID=5679 RepID=A0A088RMI5_LEIPA|nr:hypothetical protein LPMP_180610 [Leishmania panamensis]AIN97242.1 hypothetical protein LPMP_180610 [Leishmania panamensis]